MEGVHTALIVSVAHVYIPKPKPGYPATTEHSDVIPAPPGGIAKSMYPWCIQQVHICIIGVAETVQHFITAMDSIKLNLISVDALHPLVSDIVDSLNKNMNLPPDFDGKVKLRNWYAHHIHICSLVKCSKYGGIVASCWEAYTRYMFIKNEIMLVVVCCCWYILRVPSGI